MHHCVRCGVGQAVPAEVTNLCVRMCLWLGQAFAWPGAVKQLLASLRHQSSGSMARRATGATERFTTLDKVAAANILALALQVATA